MRFALVAFILGLALLPLPAEATSHEAVEDVNARSLSVLAFHPLPDPNGDPWGLPYVEENGSSVDFMKATYDAYWFPTAVFDGLETIPGATTFLETFNAYEATYRMRSAIDAPVRIFLLGAIDGENLTLDIRLLEKVPVDSQNLTLRVVLFEDDISFDGGNGVELHRFTARRHVAEVPVTFGPEGNFSTIAAVTRDAEWNLGRLGFAASLVNQDPGSVAFENHEVLQAATYLFSQLGPTIQHSRGVLLEVYTATWCAACVYGDAAVDEMANAYGVASSRILERDFAYLRPWDLPTVALALAVGLVIGLVLPKIPRRPEAP